MVACAGGHTVCVSLLLNAGARLPVEDVLGRTALHYATGHCCPVRAPRRPAPHALPAGVLGCVWAVGLLSTPCGPARPRGAPPARGAVPPTRGPACARV
jgi:hypothetical protein